MKVAWWLLAGVLALSGCEKTGASADSDEKSSDEDDDGERKKKKKKDKDTDDDGTVSAKAETTASATATATTTAEAPVAASADAPPVVTGADPVLAAPGGRSVVPTLDEWNAVTREVAVRGSSKLNCETKMVREWLRISCRGKNFLGGDPAGLKVTKGGGRGDDFAFTGDKVTSLVVRFVPGVDLEAEFEWTNTVHILRVFWPRGAPEPEAKGEFQGV